MSSLLLSSNATPGLSLPLNTARVEMAHTPALGGFVVTGIHHYREKVAFGHEFFIVRLFKSTRTVSIRVERRPFSRRPALLALLSGSPPERLTQDTLSVVGSEFNPSQYYAIEYVECPLRPRFTLRDLFDICDTIDRVAPHFRLPSTHGYWFCAAFMQLLQVKQGMVFVRLPDFKRRGRYRCLKVIYPSAVHKQLWNALPSQPRQQTLELPTEPLMITLGEDEPKAWTLHKTLEGHTGSVFSVAFTSDGASIVSGSSDRTVRIWSTETGVMVGQPLYGHTNDVKSVAISYDDHWIASASSDKTVRIWDLTSGETVGEPLTGHTEGVSSVAFSPDNHHLKLVSGSWDNTLQIWDVETGKPVGKPMRGHTHWVHSVAYSSDGTFIVSGSWDKTVRVWDAITGQAVGGPLQGHTHWVRSVAVSPDNTQIISGSDDKTIRLWDARTGQPLGQSLKRHTSMVTSVSISPDGSQIVSGSHDQTVCIWDIKTGKLVRKPLQEHTDWVWSVAFSPNGKQIASGSEDETICIWNTMA